MMRPGVATLARPSTTEVQRRGDAEDFRSAAASSVVSAPMIPSRSGTSRLAAGSLSWSLRDDGFFSRRQLLCTATYPLTGRTGS